jgi:hypothetical protein
MMNAREVNIKERISLVRQDYSVFKENMKDKSMDGLRRHFISGNLI